MKENSGRIQCRSRSGLAWLCLCLLILGGYFYYYDRGLLRPYTEIASLHVSGMCQGAEIFKEPYIPCQTSWDSLDEGRRWTVPNSSFTTPQWIGDKNVDLAVFLTGDNVHFWELMQPTFKDYITSSTERTWTMYMEEIQQLSQMQSSRFQFGLLTASQACGDNDIQREFYSERLRTVDEVFKHIPDSRPIVNRFTCADQESNASALETLMARLTQVSAVGNFVEADMSIINYHDPSFSEMLPAVTWTYDYPFPFITGGNLLMEFASGPCDSLYCGWNGSECRRPFGGAWLNMWQAMAERAFLRHGILTFCCHPSSTGRAPANQVREFVKYIRAETDGRARFLTFRQAQTLMQEHAFFGQPLRREDGMDNGVRLVDLDRDGYMDVIVGNDVIQKCAIWDRKAGKWRRIKFPFRAATGGVPTALILGYSSTGNVIALLGRERAFLARNGESWSWRRVAADCEA